jgi:hypothetical protein
MTARGMPNFPKPSPVEVRMMALYDRFDSLFNNRGERAATEFVDTLEGNAPPMTTYRLARVRQRTVPKGGLLAAAQARFAAAEAAWLPFKADHDRLNAEREPILQEIGAIGEDAGIFQRRKLKALQARCEELNKQLNLIGEELETSDSERALALAEYSAARSALTEAESIVYQARARIAQRAKENRQDLNDLLDYTDDPADRAVLIELR